MSGEEPSLFRNKYRIKSAKCPDWDYSSDGAYFVTICTQGREEFFGDMVDGKMMLSKIGQVADKFWTQIPEHFPFVVLDEYIVMPNHVHGILFIEKNDVDCGPVVETQNFASLQMQGKTQGIKNKKWKPNKFGPQSKNLASIIRGFKVGVKKYATTNEIDFSWQPRFHDRIVRDENELNRIRQYIIDNPTNWQKDRNNLENLFL